MSARWVPTGNNLMWATYVGDAQVIYLLRHDTTYTSKGRYEVIKKVSGAADRTGYMIGCQTKLEDAKWIAEHDSRQPL